MVNNTVFTVFSGFTGPLSQGLSWPTVISGFTGFLVLTDTSFRRINTAMVPPFLKWAVETTRKQSINHCFQEHGLVPAEFSTFLLGIKGQ